MSRTERVHIVMATYNGAKFLKEQMDSLLRQTHNNITIEVCDDGSTDETCNMVEQYMEKDNRITLHRNEKNLGYVFNFMEGIRRSDAQYIMLCDQDDIWKDDKVEKTLNRMKQEESITEGPILVFSDAMNYNSDTEENLGRFHENSHLDVKKVDTAHLFMENKCIGCTVMVNKQIQPYLKELPKQIRVHDWWLALICSHFGKLVYLDEPTLLYRQHGGNMIGGSSFGNYFGNRMRALQEQREVLKKTYEQGAAFVQMFEGQMTEKQCEIAKCFAHLGQTGWIKRRYHAAKYGFLKSGLVRNIGLFILL